MAGTHTVMPGTLLNGSATSAIMQNGMGGSSIAAMGSIGSITQNGTTLGMVSGMSMSDPSHQTHQITPDINEQTGEGTAGPAGGGGGAENNGDMPVQEEEEEPVIDIMINNVVCSFSVSCHLDLRNIALTGNNVEFRRENGMVTMKLRRPLTTASIWSSGKITCTGSTSESQARVAARRIARCLQKLGYTIRFRNFRIVNVLGTCTMPFGIKIAQFSQTHRKAASYEPELHPGVTYKIEHPKATLKIFSTGSITVTAPSVNNVQMAIEHIYPLVKEFGKDRTAEELAEVKKAPNPYQFLDRDSEYEDEEDDDDLDDDDDF